MGKSIFKKSVLLVAIFLGSGDLWGRRHRPSIRKRRIIKRKKSKPSETFCEKMGRFVDNCALGAIGVLLFSLARDYSSSILSHFNSTPRKFSTYIPDGLMPLVLDFQAASPVDLVDMYGCRIYSDDTLFEAQRKRAECDAYYKPFLYLYNDQEYEDVYYDESTIVVPDLVSRFGEILGDPNFQGYAAPLVDMYGCRVDGNSKAEIEKQVDACMSGNFAALLGKEKVEKADPIEEIQAEEEVPEKPANPPVISNRIQWEPYRESLAVSCKVVGEKIVCE